MNNCTFRKPGRLWLVLSLLLSSIAPARAAPATAPGPAPRAALEIAAPAQEIVAIDPGPWSQYEPTGASDSDGNLYAVWMDDREGETFIRFAYRPAGGAWQPSVRLDPTGDERQSGPQIAVDGGGNAYAVWVDERDARRQVRFAYRPAGGDWGASQVISPTTHFQTSPRLAVNRRGEAVVAWLQGEKLWDWRHVFAAVRSTDGQWSAAEEVNDVGVDQSFYSVDAAMDNWGRAHLAWRALVRTDFKDHIFFASRPAGGPWSAQESVIETTKDLTAPRMAVDLAGNVHLLWGEFVQWDEVDIYAVYRPVGGGWSAKVRVNENSGELAGATIGVDGAGNVIAAWSSFANDGQVWTAIRPRGGDWGAPQLLFDGPPTPTASSAAVVGSNAAQAAQDTWNPQYTLPGGGFGGWMMNGFWQGPYGDYYNVFQGSWPGMGADGEGDWHAGNGYEQPAIESEHAIMLGEFLQTLEEWQSWAAEPEPSLTEPGALGSLLQPQQQQIDYQQAWFLGQLSEAINLKYFFGWLFSGVSPETILQMTPEERQVFERQLFSGYTNEWYADIPRYDIAESLALRGISADQLREWGERTRYSQYSYDVALAGIVRTLSPDSALASIVRILENAERLAEWVNRSRGPILPVTAYTILSMSEEQRDRLEQAYAEAERGQAEITDPILPHSGEFVRTETPLRIPGRGLDYEFRLTYRSQLVYDGPVGWGWTHNYDQRMVDIGGGSLARRTDAGLTDVFPFDGAEFLPATGRYSTVVSDTTGITLTHRGGLVESYFPLSDATAPGRLRSLTDRNGNSLTFAYDAQGRLTTVTDALGRAITYAYDENGRISTVTDFTGRTVTLAYDSDGNLVSITTPAVTGTPNGNDFPDGKTTVFSYTSGFEDERLNHNLTTIIAPNEVADGSLIPRTINTYGTSGLEFDRVVQQSWGGGRANAGGIPAGGEVTLVYTTTIEADDPPGAASKTIITDRGGNVVELWHDGAGHRLRSRQVVDGQVLITDYTYNADGLMTSITYPAENRVEYTYDEGAADRFAQGNLLEVRHVADPARGCDGLGSPCPDLTPTSPTSKCSGASPTLRATPPPSRCRPTGSPRPSPSSSPRCPTSPTPSHPTCASPDMPSG